MYFSTAKENYPWFQWHLPNRTQVVGIVLSNTYNGKGNLLQNVEIRAGTTPTDIQFNGKITTNKFCGKLDKASNDRRVYTVMCKNDVDADYVTIQIMDKNAKLELNEIEVITKSEGKPLF